MVRRPAVALVVLSLAVAALACGGAAAPRPATQLAASRFDVPPAYLKAIIAKESGGYWDDPKSGSIIQNPDSHATGLVQAMPDDGNRQLAQTLGLDRGYTDPAQNIMLGAAILAEKHVVALSMGAAGEGAWIVAAGGYFGVSPGTMDETDATGTSGDQYVGDVIGMVNEIRSSAPGDAATPVGIPAATPTVNARNNRSILESTGSIGPTRRLFSNK